jgi:hypothetical protein
MGPLYALRLSHERSARGRHRLVKPRPQTTSSFAQVAGLGSPPGRIVGSARAFESER